MLKNDQEYHDAVGMMITMLRDHKRVPERFMDAMEDYHEKHRPGTTQIKTFTACLRGTSHFRAIHVPFDPSGCHPGILKCGDYWLRLDIVHADGTVDYVVTTLYEVPK
jgi:hypothetical protein